MSAFAHGLWLAGQNDFSMKPAGDGSQVATFPVNDDATTRDQTPRYRVADIFDQAAAASLASGVEIDAMSTGNDMLPFVRVDDGNYHVHPPSGTGATPWGAVVVSVDGGTTASSQSGSIYDARHQALSGSVRGADLFSWWLAGNQGLGTTFDGNGFLTAGHEHMGLGAAQQVQALDSFMPIAFQNQSADALAPLLPTWRKLLFSVTESGALHIRTNWSVFQNDIHSGAQHTPSEIRSGTIFEVIWDEFTGQWGQVEILKQPEDFGLPTGADIDALGHWNGTDWFLLSVKQPSPLPQLMIAHQGDGNTSPLQDPNGTPVTQSVGVPPDIDIDSVCAWDPEHGLSYWCAYPIANAAMVGDGPGISVQRVYHPGGDAEAGFPPPFQAIRVQVTGIPATHPYVQLGWFDGQQFTAIPSVVGVASAGTWSVELQVPPIDPYAFPVALDLRAVVLDASLGSPLYTWAGKIQY